MIRNRWLLIACATVCMLAAAGVATAQNILTNPGMEDGPTGYGVQGWNVFGNVYTEANNGWPFAAYEGTKMMSFFGTWCGAWCVSGMFQEYPSAEGVEWTFSCKSRHHNGDPLTGVMPTGNWVVQKLAFFDAGNAEIAAVESVILDGTWPTEVWHDNAPIMGVSPAGAVKVQALILYIQPAFDGGACQIDNAELYVSDMTVPNETAAFGQVKALFR
jgi:hypothetical protein